MVCKGIHSPLPRGGGIVIAGIKSIFVGKNRIKTRPDSLTYQRLPGINDTKIVFFSWYNQVNEQIFRKKFTTVRIKSRTCSLSRWKLIKYIVPWIFGLNFVLLQMGLKWLWFAVMRTKKTIFSQIMSLVSRYDFQKCVDRYKGDWHAKTLTCIDQFKIMSFAQFTDRSSLRDIEMTLEFCGKGLYHAGLRTVPKSTLAEANEKRNWMISIPYSK